VVLTAGAGVLHAAADSATAPHVVITTPRSSRYIASPLSSTYGQTETVYFRSYATVT